MEKPKVVIAYVPVLHSGYLNYFEGHRPASVYLAPGEMSELKFFSKDIRGIEPGIMAEALCSIYHNRFFGVLTEEMIEIIQRERDVIYMPDEEISHEIHKKYFLDRDVIFENVFLRWHRRKLEEQTEVTPHFRMPIEGFLRKVFDIGVAEAKKSSDWWLQVGAVIWNDKKIILKGFNAHLPSPRVTEVLGDARGYFTRGKNIELTTSLHAEAGLIVEAAKFGIPLRGKSLFTTVFPCPPCAKLIAKSGIRLLYYLDGYSLLDGEVILKEEGVMLVKLTR